MDTYMYQRGLPVRRKLTFDSLVGNSFSNHGFPTNCAIKFGSGGGGGGGVGRRGGLGGGVGVRGGLQCEKVKG